MAKSVRTGSTRDRMSSIVAGDKSGYGASTVRLSGALQNPRYGSPVSRLKDYSAAQVVNPSKVALEKPKNIPRTFLPTVRPPVKKPVVAAKPVVKPPVKKPPAVVSNVVREKLSPVPNSSVSKKPPATRFGTVTGKTTGTRVSGGGGYGGGGTRGSGSLSGGGSGTRSAGTSRTGGTRSNDPVRG